MISRRAFLALLAGSGLAAAQAVPKTGRVGILTLRRRDSAAAWLQRFRDAFVEMGTPLSVELRFADGDAAKLRALADELGKRAVEIIVATDEPSFAAAKRLQLPVVAA